MKIKSLNVKNYKCFRETGPVLLNPGWNVVVGQNNSGKTAFIESFRLRSNSANPHRHVSKPKGQPLNTNSTFRLSISVEIEWLKNKWLERGGAFGLRREVLKQLPGANELEPHTFWDQGGVIVDVEFTASGGAMTMFNRGNDNSSGPNAYHFLFYPNGERQIADNVDRIVECPDTIGELLGNYINEKVYVFDAKRFALGRCGAHAQFILSQDASNLPAVLHQMQNNPRLFDDFVSNVQSVFPGVEGISVPLQSNNEFEIKIWPVPTDSMRDDLAVPLNQSGAGLGQVLSILYVAMTITDGVIVIDEPNSFLHPGATKKLVGILKRYASNQYIISSHSSDLISASMPASIHLVRNSSGESEIESFADIDVQERRMLLSEIGVSMSDVFGADMVVWVEGPTEKICFDIIRKEVLGRFADGVEIAALRNTGDLERAGVNAQMALDIYERLSAGGGIVPASVKFSFDLDGRSDSQISDIRRRLGGRANFIPRRMTENYFLHPDAVCNVLTSLDCGGVTVDEVKVALSKAMQLGEYDPHVDVRDVNGAKILKDVFEDLSGGTITYRKINYGPLILRYIIKHDISHVSELVEYVESLTSPII